MSIPTIVVGVDGDPASHSALRLAIDEATLRRCRVMVIACWSHETRYLSPRADGREADTYNAAQMIVREAVASVAASAHERSILVTSVSQGEPGPALVHASREADLLIIGSTTRGALARWARKTVVDHCLRYSDVPVLVVPYVPVGVEEADIDRELFARPHDEGADIPRSASGASWAHTPSRKDQTAPLLMIGVDAT